MHIDLLLASALRQFDCPAKFSQFTILQQAQGVCVQEINATDGFILDEFFFCIRRSMSNDDGGAEMMRWSL